MGMAASQARLLTVTARLNHIERQSQAATNSKIRLSSKTQDASDEYIKALNKTDMLYSTYNSQGDIVNEKLTGNALSFYGPLKNQYGLINSAGQIMVSEIDGANYQKSNTLQEFLDNYGVLSPEGSGDTIQVENPEYKGAMEGYEEELAKWKELEPKKIDEKYWSESTGKDDALYQQFLGASQPCYSHIDNEADGCYKHVLAHLIDLTGDGVDKDFKPTGYPKTYKTTLGNDTVIQSEYLTGTYIMSAGKCDDMIDVSKAVCDPENIIYAAPNEAIKAKLLDVWNSTDPAVTQKMKDNELLMSNYYIDKDGNAQLKTLKQKTIDLLYVSLNYRAMGIPYNDVLVPVMVTFQEDMEQAFKKPEFDEKLFGEDHGEWEAGKPAKPDVPFYIDKIVRKITDTDKAQWYVNLWHRMNGTSDFKGGFGSNADYKPEDGFASKSKTEQSWVVLKDGDMNSPEWIKFALENGLVTLEQVQFTDPSKDDTGVKNIKWNSIITSSAQDILEQKNSNAATLAEVKYNQDLASIQAKDKAIDNNLKKLDTEHKALQTEYDSIDSVIKKNVERSFKIFS